MKEICQVLISNTESKVSEVITRSAARVNSQNGEPSVKGAMSHVVCGAKVSRSYRAALRNNFLSLPLLQRLKKSKRKSCGVHCGMCLTESMGRVHESFGCG
jgi:hypothetical protein